MLNGENIKIVRRQRREHNTIKFKNDFCNLIYHYKLLQLQKLELLK